jgi:hypothetical protein
MFKTGKEETARAIKTHTDLPSPFPLSGRRKAVLQACLSAVIHAGPSLCTPLVGACASSLKKLCLPSLAARPGNSLASRPFILPRWAPPANFPQALRLFFFLPAFCGQIPLRPPYCFPLSLLLRGVRIAFRPAKSPFAGFLPPGSPFSCIRLPAPIPGKKAACSGDQAFKTLAFPRFPPAVKEGHGF